MTTLSPATTSFGSVTSTVVLLKFPSLLFSQSSIPPSLSWSSVNVKVGLTSGVTSSVATSLFQVLEFVLSVT